MLVFGRNQQNSVKQLFFNLKINKTKQKLNIQKTEIWSHHFKKNRWGEIGKSDRFYFWGSKITANGDYGPETKRLLLLGRKVMTNLKFSVLRAKSLQSCLTLCNAMDWTLPGSSVHGILQTRILEWVAISFSRGSSWSSIELWSLMSLALAAGVFTISTTWGCVI